MRKKQSIRPPKKRRGTGSKKINQVSINHRPNYIEDRVEINHWEADLIISKNYKRTIGSIVERKAKYTIIIKLNSKKADEVAKVFSEKLNQLNNIFKKPMT